MILREKKKQTTTTTTTMLPFQNFLAVPPSPLYMMLKSGKKKSGNMHTTLFVEWGEGLGMSKLKKKSPTNAKVS